jgi:hypothetical protein
MSWVLAGLTLIMVGYVCRRVLHLDRRSQWRRGLMPLSAEREQIYQPVALEIETQTAILGITLNEALGEREFGNQENAWRLVRLAVCQWDRLAEIVSLMLHAIAEDLSASRSIVAVRSITTNRFRSRAMIEFVGTWDLLDQLIFRSKLRYQLHIRVLRRAIETLTAEFRRSYRSAERSSESADEMWGNLDPAFHDYDLIIKESLLALRAFLIALPDSALQDFASSLKSVVTHSVRSKSVPAPRQVEF